MFIETYHVEEYGGQKYIHYNGYTWMRQDDDSEGKCYAATEGTGCYIPVGEDNYRRACEAFELVKQYQYDMTEGELLDYECGWKANEYLHMNDVAQDTPCGSYWFE